MDIWNPVAVRILHNKAFSTCNEHNNEFYEQKRYGRYDEDKNGIQNVMAFNWDLWEGMH